MRDLAAPYPQKHLPCRNKGSTAMLFEIFDMAKFKVKFQLKGENGQGKGNLIEEIIEAPNIFDAKELINRKYGGVFLWGGPLPVNESSSTSSSSTGSQSKPNGCMVALGGIALLIGLATGAFKPSTEPDAYQTPTPSSPSGEASSPSADKAPAQEPVENTESPVAQELWGAFAISPSTGESSWAKGYSTESEAQQAAVRSCGQDDCNAFGFTAGAAALVESDSRWYHESGRSSEEEASSMALQQCQREEPAGNCRMVASFSF